MVDIKQLSKLASNFVVLYVEDETQTRESIAIILKAIFTNVLVATDGTQGIEIAKNNKINLIISDINMPKCNGLDMVESIKTIYPQIPTILITALEDPKMLVRSIDLGIDKYIIKPIVKDKLFEAIEEVLYLLTSKQKYKNEQISLSKNIKMIAISKLLDNLTHQWRQSLNIISISCTSIMMQEDEKISNKSIQSLLGSIENTVLNMDKELQDILLDFEKEHKKEYFSIKDVTEKAIKFFKIDLDKNNIQVTNNIEDIFIFNSPDSYTQILHNILENSIDALVLNNNTNKYIEFNSTQENKQAIINIIDNGGGISESIIDEIFEPYSTTKHKYIGTGLGLYISYILATKSMNGMLQGNNITKENQQCAMLSLIL